MTERSTLEKAREFRLKNTPGCYNCANILTDCPDCLSWDDTLAGLLDAERAEVENQARETVERVIFDSRALLAQAKAKAEAKLAEVEKVLARERSAYREEASRVWRLLEAAEARIHELVAALDKHAAGCVDGPAWFPEEPGRWCPICAALASTETPKEA